MFPYELDAVFEHIFRKKLRVPPLVDPRAVEKDIFADLTISKRQKTFKILHSNVVLLICSYPLPHVPVLWPLY
jgi:hypothetical protein